MRCIIKNVPPISFNVLGNRGSNFPLVETCAFLDLECLMVKEEDGETLILCEHEIDEIGKPISLDCVSPEKLKA